MNTKIILLLALAVCVVSSQTITGGRSRCLCKTFRDNLGVGRKLIENLTVIPPSNSCGNMEIILTLKNGNQYCLNPNAKKIRDILRILASKKANSQPQ